MKLPVVESELKNKLRLRKRDEKFVEKQKISISKKNGNPNSK